MDFNANDVGYIPSNALHYIEHTGDTDLVFLETFATDEFMDVSLNQWLRRVPSEMLKAHLNSIGRRLSRLLQKSWRSI
jgi:oxalate decarboxylase